MSAKIASITVEKTKINDCPICRNKSISPHTPFCSRRCSQLDLSNWLREAYFIPSYDVQDDIYAEKNTLEKEKKFSKKID